MPDPHRLTRTTDVRHCSYDVYVTTVQCVVEALMLNTARRTALLVLFLAASVVIIKVPLGLTAEAFSGQKDASPDAE